MLVPNVLLRGWIPAGHPYAGRKTEGRSPFAAAGFFPSAERPKNNGIIMNRIFYRSQNIAAYYRRAQKQESSNPREIVANLDLPFVEHVNII